MAKYDGSIRIDTRIDAKNFNSGIKGLEGGLKPILGILAKIALAVVAAFSVKAVLDFTVNVTKLAAEFERLQIAAEAVGQLHGFASGETKKLTQSLIDNGIQTDIANRAFINFAQNGLDANLLPALARGAQDLAVFAESGETSSDVLDRIAYGILNLNELMLRRANVAIDISQAEAEYAKQIGVSTEAMTVQQKRTAVSIAVLEKLKDVQGLYTLSQKTAAGQLASNVRIMNEFKAAIGSTFQGAFFKLIKGWNDLVKVMTASIKAGGVLHELFIRIGTVAAFLADIIAGLFRAIASLFGVELSSAIDTASDDLDTNAGAAGAAADAQGDLASATEAAGKAAKGALASFDELNVLQQDTGDAGAGTGDLGAGGFPDGAAADFSSILDEINAKQAEIQARVDALKAKLADFFKPLVDAYNKYLKPVLIELGGKIWAGLVWVWDNILKPLGAWLVQVFAPVFTEFLGAAFGVLASTLDALAPHLQVIWDTVLKPFAEWLGTVLVKAFEWLTTKLIELRTWIDNNQEAWIQIVGILTIVGVLIAAFGLAAVASLAPIVAGVAALVFILAYAGKAWKMAVDLWKLAVETFKNILFYGARWIIDHAIQPMIDAFARFQMRSRDEIYKIKTYWIDVFTGIRDFFKGILNSMISGINGLIYRVTSGINSLIYAANVAGSILPGFSPVGYVSPKYVPYLATGAVIPPNSSFLAVLGDQKSGRNIEAPESLIRQIINEEIGNIKAEVEISFTGSLAALVRDLKPHIDRENVRIGSSLIRSGVTAK